MLRHHEESQLLSSPVEGTLPTLTSDTFQRNLPPKCRIDGCKAGDMREENLPTRHLWLKVLGASRHVKQTTRDFLGCQCVFPPSKTLKIREHHGFKKTHCLGTVLGPFWDIFGQLDVLNVIQWMEVGEWDLADMRGRRSIKLQSMQWPGHVFSGPQRLQSSPNLGLDDSPREWTRSPITSSQSPSHHRTPEWRFAQFCWNRLGCNFLIPTVLRFRHVKLDMKLDMNSGMKWLDLRTPAAKQTLILNVAHS